MLVRLCYVMMMSGVHGPRLGRSRTHVADCRRMMRSPHTVASATEQSGMAVRGRRRSNSAASQNTPGSVL